MASRVSVVGTLFAAAGGLWSIASAQDGRPGMGSVLAVAGLSYLIGHGVVILWNKFRTPSPAESVGRTLIEALKPEAKFQLDGKETSIQEQYEEALRAYKTKLREKFPDLSTDGTEECWAREHHAESKQLLPFKTLVDLYVQRARADQKFKTRLISADTQWFDGIQFDEKRISKVSGPSIKLSEVMSAAKSALEAAPPKAKEAPKLPNSALFRTVLTSKYEEHLREYAEHRGAAFRPADLSTLFAPIPPLLMGEGSFNLNQANGIDLTIEASYLKRALIETFSTVPGAFEALRQHKDLDVGVDSIGALQLKPLIDSIREELLAPVSRSLPAPVITLREATVAAVAASRLAKRARSRVTGGEPHQVRFADEADRAEGLPRE